MKTLRRSWYLVLTLTLIVGAQGNANADDKDSSLSPDGQWRYALVEDHWPEVQKASTAKRAVDLMANERSAPHSEWNQVVWAPDSKRFAFNYGPPTVPHSTYVTTAFYQLRGEEWILLDSPINEDSSKDTFAELAKHLPKGVRAPRLWRADPNRVVFKVRKWADADTAILYVYSAGTSSGGGDSPAAFLFTLKFDPEGKCKIVTAQKAPKEKDDD